MKTFIYILISLFTFTSCSHKTYVIRNSIHGALIDNHTKKPINDAEVNFINYPKNNLIILSYKDSTLTNTKGIFHFSERTIKIVKRIGTGRTKLLPTAEMICIKKKGYISDTINITNYTRIKNNEISLDTIYLKRK